MFFVSSPQPFWSPNAVPPPLTISPPPPPPLGGAPASEFIPNNGTNPGAARRYPVCGMRWRAHAAPLYGLPVSVDTHNTEFFEP